MKILGFIILLTFCSSALADQEAAAMLQLHGIELQDTDRLQWNQAKTALAYCSAETPSNCFIIDTKFAVNVSQVEYGNLIKLRLYPPDAYEKVYTIPDKWLRSERHLHMVTFKTHAWRNAQRYTVREPALVNEGAFHGR